MDKSLPPFQAAGLASFGCADRRVVSTHRQRVL